jgi:RNA-binding protein
VVQVGAAGVTDAIVGATEEALRRHELIKVKLPKLEAETRKAMAEELAARSRASLVQLMGRVVLLYADRGEDLPKKPRIQLPA